MLVSRSGYRSAMYALYRKQADRLMDRAPKGQAYVPSVRDLEDQLCEHKPIDSGWDEAKEAFEWLKKNLHPEELLQRMQADFGVEPARVLSSQILLRSENAMHNRDMATGLAPMERVHYRPIARALYNENGLQRLSHYSELSQEAVDVVARYYVKESSLRENFNDAIRNTVNHSNRWASGMLPEARVERLCYALQELISGQRLDHIVPEDHASQKFGARPTLAAIGKGTLLGTSMIFAMGTCQHMREQISPSERPKARIVPAERTFIAPQHKAVEEKSVPGFGVVGLIQQKPCLQDVTRVAEKAVYVSKPWVRRISLTSTKTGEQDRTR